jgi:hypothetical protein
VQQGAQALLQSQSLGWVKSWQCILELLPTDAEHIEVHQHIEARDGAGNHVGPQAPFGGANDHDARIGRSAIDGRKSLQDSWRGGIAGWGIVQGPVAGEIAFIHLVPCLAQRVGDLWGAATLLQAIIIDGNRIQALTFALMVQAPDEPIAAIEDHQQDRSPCLGRCDPPPERHCAQQGNIQKYHGCLSMGV